MNALKLITSIGAMLLSGTTTLLAEEQITTEAYIVSREEDRFSIFLKLSANDNVNLAKKYNVYHKAGKPDDTCEFTLCGLILHTNDVSIVESQIFMADFAGFDNTGLEAELNDLLGEGARNQSLAKKLLRARDSELSNEQKEALVKAFPQIAMTQGTGFVAICALGFNSFEIRGVEDGKVVGRATLEGKAPEPPTSE